MKDLEHANGQNEKTKLLQIFLEETINALNDGIIILDKKGKILKTNKMLQQILKLPPSEIEGRKITQILKNRTFETFLNTYHEVINKDVKLRLHNSSLQKVVLLNAKPIFREEKMIGSLIIIREIKKVRQFVNHLSGNRAKVTFQDIIGNDPKLLQSIDEAKLVAKTESTVLLLGESGTGKDLLAQAIHNESTRQHHPFLAINCGGIPRDLLGSDLFGYVDGAFTGARKGGHAGKFEIADEGTLFFDEIGEMSLEMQVLLLRAIENQEIVRIGGAKVIPINVRIIAATNKNLWEEVQKGSFREDLYYRLNVMPIHLPTLRERQDDIPLLVNYFTKKFANQLKKAVPSIPNEVMELFKKYKWPGNVRELQNILERILVKNTGKELTANLIGEELDLPVASIEKNQFFLPRKDEIKRKALLDSINSCGGNLSKAADNLGISRSTLYRQMKRYNVH